MLGRLYDPGPKLKGWAESAGYVSVTETVVTMPIGRWQEGKKQVSMISIPPFYIYFMPRISRLKTSTV